MSTAISTLITRARTRLNEEDSTVFHTDENLVAYADEAQKYTVRETKCLTAIDSSETAEEGVQNYDLPSDWFAIKRILFDGKKLFKTDFDEIDERGIDETDLTGTPTSYYEWDDDIWLIPTPGGGDEGKIIKVYYYKQPSEITATTSTLDTKAIYDDIIICYMVYLALLKELEYEAADYILGEYHTKIRQKNKNLKEKDQSSPPRFRRSTNIKTRDGLAR